MKKYPISLSLLTHSLVAGMLVFSASARADEAPLDGPAYQFAAEAYDAFKQGKFNLAAAKAREAIQLRPDVPRLHELLKKSEQAQRTASATSVSDAAHKAAVRAYAAYDAKDYAAAVQSARKAVQLSGHKKSYWLLLINALAAAGELEEAQQVSGAAMKAYGLDADLVKAQQAVQAQMAFQASNASYQAMRSGKLDLAIVEAQKAVDYLPKAPALRVALINALIAANRLDEAGKSAEDMIVITGPAAEALLLKAAVSQKRNDRKSATEGFDRALAAAKDAARDTMHLVATDAALVNGDLTRAQETLASLKDSATVGLSERRALLTLISGTGLPRESSDKHIFNKLVFNLPAVTCTTDTDTSMTCDVRPGAAPGNPAFLAADEAYRAFSQKDFAAASSNAALATQFAPGDRNYWLLYIQALAEQRRFNDAEDAAAKALAAVGNDAQILLARAKVKAQRGGMIVARADYEQILALENKTTRTEIEALAGLGDRERARERMRAAATNPDKKDYLELAYLALALNEDHSALELFSQAESSGVLTDAGRYDGAFAAARLGNNKVASEYLSKTVDAAGEGRLSLDTQQVYQARRAISDLARTWGVRATVSQRGIAAAGIGIPGGATTDGVDAGAEAYWRPYGMQNGRVLEVYGRVNAAVSGGKGVQTGSDTTQGALGLRIKPLSESNLIFALERLVPIGSASIGDWLARTGFSSDFGLDLRRDRTNWFSGRVYAEAGHYFRSSQNYATLEGQLGRSYLLGDAGSTLTVFPHVVIGGEYDSAAFNREKQAWGSGIGTSVRYWFRQDRYNAPHSYADLSVQYRWRVAGDSRAEGFFVRLSMSY